MNENLIHGILMKSMNELMRKTKVNYSMMRDKIKVLNEAKQQAHGINLVYRSAVHHSTSLKEFENAYFEFLTTIDKRIFELED